MGDEHFVLLVDRLLIESTHPNQKKDSVSFNSLFECRICLEEDEDSNMETPCSCRGSLQYTHRKCVQRWCNEKGDITCEICLQPFKPGYILPGGLSPNGPSPVNFRGSLAMSRRSGAFNHPSIAISATDQGFRQSEYDEDFASNARSMIHCRLVALTVRSFSLSCFKHVCKGCKQTRLQFMVLLVLRHTLPVFFADAESYSPTIFALALLRTAGVILPLYIMWRAVPTLRRHCRHHQQEIQQESMMVRAMEGGNSSAQSPPPPPAAGIEVR